MSIIFENFKLIYATGDFTEISKPWQRPKHFSSYNRLYSLRSGEGEFTIGQETVQLKEGCTYLFPSGRITSYNFSQKASLDWIHFDARLYGNLPLFDFLKCPLSLKTPKDALSRKLYQQLFELQAQGSSKSLYETPALLQILLAPFLNQGEINKHAESFVRLKPIFDYIEQNISTAPRSAELARLINLEPNYFISLFSKTVGVPPAKFIHQRRMEIACTLVMADKPLSEITEALTYYDSAHFCRTFKKHTGFTPLQYKEQFKQEIKDLKQI